MRQLLINVIDVPLKEVVLQVDEKGNLKLDEKGKPMADPMLDKTGNPILDEYGKPMVRVNQLGSIRQISANNKAASDYFNSLFPVPTQGGTRKRRKTRRRKSRKH